jgi:hypothetical protein
MHLSGSINGFRVIMGSASIQAALFFGMVSGMFGTSAWTIQRDNNGFGWFLLGAHGLMAILLFVNAR